MEKKDIFLHLTLASPRLAKIVVEPLSVAVYSHHRILHHKIISPPMTPDVRPFALLTPTAHTSVKRQKVSFHHSAPDAKPPSLDTPPPPRAHPSSMAAKMEIVSPASPMGLRLSSDINKGATVFLSHVRRTFHRSPVDYTGELVRLLDDIANYTCTIASAVAERSPYIHYGHVGQAGELKSEHAIKQLYRILAHDGYCCIILAKGHEQPLTFDPSVLHGNYVVCISPLDVDPNGSDERCVAGMTFSIYKRKSSTSLPGRGIDLQQNLADQVAAGYASFSSATTLYYTMGHGVYSFVMHPVALQYFLQPAMRVAIPENPTTVYSDRAILHSSTPIAASLSKMVDKFCCSMFTTGCLIGDLQQLLQTGGVLVAHDVHLMCEAAPVAFIIEQCGGVATDEYGQRILAMKITEDHDVTLTVVFGTPNTHKNLALVPKPQPSNGVNGNGNLMSP